MVTALWRPTSGTTRVFSLRVCQYVLLCLALLQLGVVVLVQTSETFHRQMNTQLTSVSTILSLRLDEFVGNKPNLSATTTTATTTIPTINISNGFNKSNGTLPQKVLNGSQPTTKANASQDSQPVFVYQHIPDKTDVWEDSDILPLWIKDYFAWHKKQRSQLTQQNWQTQKYLVMRCLDIDERCGGTADRIKSVPFILYWAARTERLLLIHWKRPCRLEEFLLPPRGGVDWTVPDWLQQHVLRGGFLANTDAFPRLLKQGHQTVVRSRYQSYSAGSIPYNEILGQPTFEQVFRDVWRSFFTPSPPVAQRIKQALQTLHLSPGDYAAVHLRALYAVKTRRAQLIHEWAENAVACGTNLRPGGPLYFASDSKEATDHVQTWMKQKNNNNNTNKTTPTRVALITRDYEPLHVEKTPNWRDRQPSEYYDTFVDLYLLGLSRCLSFNVGGYGQWGLWMGYNSTCYNKSTNRQHLAKCNWTEPEPNAVYPKTIQKGPILIPPMDAEGYTITDEYQLEGNKVVAQEEEEETEEEEQGPDGTDSKPLWEEKRLPQWMKEYFVWHDKVHRSLLPSNWKNHKYLIMTCTARHDHCGGVSDRLKPLPLLLLLAHRSQRLLLIKWTRPCALEEFMLPPRGGLNWTTPDWLFSEIEQLGPLAVQLSGLLPVVESSEMVVRTRYQSNNAGALYYNNQTEYVGQNNLTFETVYHDLFRTVFEPSPPVASLVNAAMEQMGLVPGHYSAAHVRALYGRQHRNPNETALISLNAVNCASELRPGGPVYFAADTKHAVDVVRGYATQHQLPIRFTAHPTEPLHLDKFENWTTSPPSDFYASFVDLYLLAQSRCVAYSNGGFGTFGLILGYDPFCSVRYFQRKILHECPHWVAA